MSCLSKPVLLSIGIYHNVHHRELSGRVLDSRPKGHGFESHQRSYVVSLSKNINPSL